ncbi:MAG: acetolactate synthase-1/2/3 large subunit [Hyphomicrobiaceae bacterium]
MNGAEALLKTLAEAGVDLCFANPGTTEMPLVAALDKPGAMRSVLCLFEGVASGAADGYARVTGRPAATLLHLGPGYANAIANFHNARRAGSPIVNLIGDHAVWHRAFDAPLTSDIESLAEPVSVHVVDCIDPARVGLDAREAVEAAMHGHGGVATMIVPQDTQWADSVHEAGTGTVARHREEIEDAIVTSAATALECGATTTLLLGGGALSEPGLQAAARIAAHTGAKVVHETFPAFMERGAGVPNFDRLPYFPEQLIETLAGCEQLVCVGARTPVSFFGYQGQPSDLVPDGCSVVVATTESEDAINALERIADQLGAAPSDVSSAVSLPDFPTDDGPLDIDGLGRIVAALQPENALVVDESATSGIFWFPYSMTARRHSWMGLTGGAIGIGLPLAVGAALGAPDRKVLALQADGSGLYTLQALWTMARENLDVTVVVCANQAYRILEFELMRAGVTEPGPVARSLTSLQGPALDWTCLSVGMGVPAERAETPGQLVAALERALAIKGPRLIEAVLAG